MSWPKQIRLPEQQLQGGLLEPVQGEHIPDEPIAVLDLEPADLEKRLGIAFQQSFDNLDYVDIALLELDSHERFALIRHRGAPSPGTEIHVPHSQASARKLDEIVRQLGLAPADLSWRKPMS